MSRATSAASCLTGSTSCRPCPRRSARAASPCWLPEASRISAIPPRRRSARPRAGCPRCGCGPHQVPTGRCRRSPRRPTRPCRRPCRPRPAVVPVSALPMTRSFILVMVCRARSTPASHHTSRVDLLVQRVRVAAQLLPRLLDVTPQLLWPVIHRLSSFNCSIVWSGTGLTSQPCAARQIQPDADQGPDAGHDQCRPRRVHRFVECPRPSGDEQQHHPAGQAGRTDQPAALGRLDGLLPQLGPGQSEALAASACSGHPQPPRRGCLPTPRSAAWPADDRASSARRAPACSRSSHPARATRWRRPRTSWVGGLRGVAVLAAGVDHAARQPTGENAERGRAKKERARTPPRDAANLVQQLPGFTQR